MSGPIHPRRPRQEKLWLAVRFPDFALQAIDASLEAETPIVIVEKRRVRIVVGANKAACTMGVAFGMDAVKAQVLVDGEVLERRRDREAAALKRLADTLYQFSPHLEIYQCDAIAQAGVLLEISTCLALFSGFTALRGQLEQCLKTTGYSYRLGLAHTAPGSWLMSFSESPFVEHSRQDYIRQLGKLPIQLLHDYPKSVETLEKTGFVTLEDLVRQIEDQSIRGLKKRFERDFIQTLCDIFGIDLDFQQRNLFEKPAAHYQPETIYQDEVQFDYPVGNTQQLHYPVEMLLQKLSDYLLRRQLECQRVEWVLRDIHGNSENMHVISDSGQTDWRLLYDLTLIQLDVRSLSFEVDRLILSCPETSPLQHRRQALNFSQPRIDRGLDQSFEISIAKLKARLGDSAIYKVSCCDSHVPEAMAESVAVSATPNQELPAQLATALRPIWVYAQPIPIEMRSQGLFWRGYLQLLAGPERILNDWWQESRARDYYLATREDASRFWVFQDRRDGSWYVHGMFA